MKKNRTRLVLLALLFSLNSIAEELPWFFRTNAFKDWVVNNNIKCIKRVGELSTFEDWQRYSDFSTAYLEQWTIEYYFDSLGVLSTMLIKDRKIGFETGQLTRSNYDYLVNQFSKLPLPISNQDLSELNKYGGNNSNAEIRVHNMHYAVDTNDLVFADLYHPVHDVLRDLNYSYSYQLHQEVKFDQYEIVSVKDYIYSGDFWVPHIRLTSFVPIDENFFVLTALDQIDDFESGYYNSYRDTVYTYPYYYKCSGDGNYKEYGVREIDSTGAYFYHTAKIFTIKDQGNQKEVVTQFPRSYENESVPFDQESYYISDCYATVRRYHLYYFDEKDILETRKHILKYDKNKMLISETVYAKTNGKWRVESVEKGTSYGYLRKTTAINREPAYLKFEFNKSGDLLIKETIGQNTELVFAASGEKITARKNNRYDYATYYVDYRH